jgi:hypothetical protein
MRNGRLRTNSPVTSAAAAPRTALRRLACGRRRAGASGGRTRRAPRLAGSLTLRRIRTSQKVARIVAVKARLEGHSFDLDTLARLFRQGDPHVGVDDKGYFLTSARLDGLIDDGSKLYEVASSLLRTANGAARVLDGGFRPVRLTLTFSDDTGASPDIVLVPPGGAELNMGIRLGGVAEGVQVLDAEGGAGGEQQHAPPPPSPKYVELAKDNRDVGEALKILGKESPSLDWNDLYKVYEIVRANVGNEEALIAKDWVPKPDIKAFTASANRPDISGDEARHARMSGSPPRQTRPMTRSEAQQLITKLVGRWVESL